MALNGILAMGVKGDWATHNIEHAVSAVHDIRGWPCDFIPELDEACCRGKCKSF